MALPRLSRPSSMASSLLTLLATSVLLTGCGDDNAPSAPGASPSSQTPDATTTRSYLAGVRSTTTPGVGDAEDTVTSVLSLVDDTTGAQVATVAVDPLTSAKVAQAFTVATDGLSYQAGRQTKAYYVYQHKLYEISLEHASNVLSLPVARQVSSEANACEVRAVVERDANAQSSYLSYTVAGNDGKCNTPDDVLKTTLSSVSAQAAVVAPALLDVQRDSSGAVSRLLGNDTDNHKLVVIDAAKLDTDKLATTTVVNGTLSGTSGVDANGVPFTTYPTVSLFGKVAASTDKVYLRVGAGVRVLDWATATLGTTNVATLNLNQTPLVRTDDTATYFVDAATAPPANAADNTKYELALWRLKPAQDASQGAAEKLASLGVVASADQLPQVQTHAMTPSALALVLRRDSGDTLTIVPKDGSSTRTVALGGTAARLAIQAHAGDVLVVSQQLTTSEDTGALTRVTVGRTSDSLAPLSALASVVTVINGSSTTIGGEVPSSYLLWNESGAVRSHNLSSNTTQTIANSSTLAGWNGSTLSATVSNLTVGLLRGLTSVTPNAETLWLFDATKAVGAN